jgi:hypothetical protein
VAAFSRTARSEFFDSPASFSENQLAMKKLTFASALPLSLITGAVLAASCSVDKSAFEFDDDAYEKARAGDGDSGGDGDGDGDTGGSGGVDAGTGGMGLGGETSTDVMPGDTRCSEKQIEFYAGGDLWVPLGSECEFLCEAGECVGSCNPGDSECVSSYEGRTCEDEGIWVDEACAFACVDAACGGECVPGQLKCSGNQKQICDEKGMWADDGDPCFGACTDSGDGSGAACTGGCSTDGATQCTGETTIEICSGGNWIDHPDGSCQFVCRDGACTGTCTPNTSACTGNNQRVTCSPAGDPGSPVPCNDSTCVNGVCTGHCEPGQERCIEGNI